MHIDQIAVELKKEKDRLNDELQRCTIALDSVSKLPEVKANKNVIPINGVKAYWAQFTPRQRSNMMRKRAAKRAA